MLFTEFCSVKMSLGTVSNLATLTINMLSFWSIVMFSMFVVLFGTIGVGFCAGVLSAIFLSCFVVTMACVLYGLALILLVDLLRLFMTLRQWYSVHGGHGLVRTSRNVYLLERAIYVVLRILRYISEYSRANSVGSVNPMSS